MLKVTVTEGDDGITLLLEGRLCGPCTAEAEQSWRSVLMRAGRRRILLDLTGIAYVGSEGKLLLTSALEQGAEGDRQWPAETAEIAWRSGNTRTGT